VAVTHIRIIAMLMLSALTVAAAFDPFNYVLDRTIEFTRPYTPYFATNFGEVARVNLDLSLNSGTNWHKRIANGLDAAWGTNVYNYSFRVTPDLWTEHARIGLRTLWSSTSDEIDFWEGAMSKADFAICGVRWVSPTNGQAVLQPGYQEFVWHEAGFDYVDIAISTNGGVSYTQLYTIASPDLTNSYFIPIMDLPTGRVDFAVVAASNLFHSINVRIFNQ